MITYHLLSAYINISRGTTITKGLSTASTLIINAYHGNNRHIPFKQNIRGRRFPIIVTLNLRQFRRLTRMSPVDLMTQRRGTRRQSVNGNHQDSALTHRVTQLYTVLLGPASVDYIIYAHILPAIPTIISRTIMRTAVRNTGPTLSPLYKVTRSHSGVSCVLERLGARVQFVSTTSILLQGVSLQFGRVRNGVSNVRVHVRSLRLEHTLKISHPNGLVTPRHTSIYQRVTGNVSLMTTTIFTALHVTSGHTRHELYFMIGLKFRFNRTTVRAGETRPLTAKYGGNVRQQTVRGQGRRGNRLTLMVKGEET